MAKILNEDINARFKSATETNIPDVFKTNKLPNNASTEHQDSTSITQPGGLKDYLYIPNWSLEEFIKERTRYVTQGTEGSTVSSYGEPGTYFYKVFFNFNTSTGLLGSLIKSTNNSTIKDNNSAWQYLTNNIVGDKFSSQYRGVLLKKRTSLEKFAHILNYLTKECPWFFKEITGIAEAIKYDFNEIAKSDGKVINIVFNQDAVDMRISTLLDLYRDACFDYKNLKEVLPENLRKFDMSVILFNPPTIGLNIKEPRNAGSNNIGVIKANDEKSMSFKCIIFKNCEIKYTDLTTLTDTLSNEAGFVNNLTMPITFERFYIYNLNNELNSEILDNLYREVAIFDELNPSLPENMLSNLTPTVTPVSTSELSISNITPDNDEESEYIENEEPYDEPTEEEITDAVNNSTPLEVAEAYNDIPDLHDKDKKEIQNTIDKIKQAYNTDDVIAVYGIGFDSANAETIAHNNLFAYNYAGYNCAPVSGSAKDKNGSAVAIRYVFKL